MGLVEFKDVSFEYSGVKVLRNISFDVKEGEIIGVAGGVGSGKTSLLKLINGLLKPDHGQVYINLLNTMDYTVADLSKRIGFVFQNPQEQLFQRRVEDEILFSLRYKNTPKYYMDSRLKDVAELLEIDDILDEKITNLPYYKKKLVSLASVLIEDRSIMVIDDPVQGLDMESKALVKRMISSLRKDKKTVFVSSNDLDFLMENVDRLILLDEGEIVGFDSFHNLLSRDEIDSLDMDRPMVNRLAKNIFGKNDVFKYIDLIELIKEK